VILHTGLLLLTLKATLDPQYKNHSQSFSLVHILFSLGMLLINTKQKFSTLIYYTFNIQMNRYISRKESLNNQFIFQYILNVCILECKKQQKKNIEIACRIANNLSQGIIDIICLDLLGFRRRYMHSQKKKSTKAVTGCTFSKGTLLYPKATYWYLSGTY